MMPSIVDDDPAEDIFGPRAVLLPSIAPGISPAVDVNTGLPVTLSGRALTIATFRRANDVVPIASTPTPEVFADRCRAMAREPLVACPDHAVLDADAARAEKGKGPGFSPARYRPGTTRLDVNVEAVSCYVIDLDGATVDAVNAAWARLEALGIQASGFTTWSHASDHKGGQCWRIVIPFAFDVDVADWRALWVLLNDHLAQGRNDPTTKNPSRLHFLPRAPMRVLQNGVIVDNVAPLFRHLTGTLFDPRPLVEKARAAAAAAAKQAECRVDDAGEKATKEPRNSGERRSSSASANRPDRVTRAKAWLARADVSLSGNGGHHAAMRVVGDVVRGFDLKDDEAITALASWNKRCAPPWSPSELRHKVSEARKTPDPKNRERGWLLNADRFAPADIRDDDDGGEDDGGAETSRTRGKKTHADLAVELCASVRLVRSPEGDPFAVIDPPWAISLRAKAFADWLTCSFHERHSRVPSSSSIKAAVSVLEGRALKATETPVFVRVGELDGARFLDRGKDVVRIDAAGWCDDPNPPVIFCRPASSAPLPTPVHGGHVNELRQLVRVDDDGWALLLMWLLAALSPMTSGTYPILLLHGTQGTAKSTTARIVRQLVDPSSSPTRRPPKETRGLLAAAKNSHVINLDNMSSLPGDLSDDLCTLVAGGGFEQRSLHTTDDLAIYRVKRPVIVNGIGDFAARSDFLSRALLVELQPFTDGERRSEADIDAAFNAAWPRVLGALLDAVVATLGAPTPTTPAVGRCVDAERMATAAESVLGLPAGAVRRALAKLDGERVAVALDGWSVYPPLCTMLKRNQGCWHGPVSALLVELNKTTPSAAHTAAGWPKVANVLTGQLERHKGDLAARGIVFDRGRTNSERVITLHMSNTDDPSADVL